MYHEGGTTIVQKRMSFLSIGLLSVTAVLITTIVSASGVVIYGMRIIDRKCDSVALLVSDTVKSLPEFREALPPALADAIDDVRRPDYVSQLDVAVRLVQDNGRGNSRALVEVTNKGDDVVSLLSMRLVGLDADGSPVVERNTWVATPLQVEDEWRGPLLPHETRRIPLRRFSEGSVTRISHEITEVRTWRAGKAVEPSAMTSAS